MTINTTDIVAQVAASAGMKRSEAQRAFVAIFSAIANGLMRRDEVRIKDFGTFKVAHRDSALRRNPKTGEEFMTSPKDVPRFVPGKALKDGLAPPPPSVPRRQSA